MHKELHIVEATMNGGTIRFECVANATAEKMKECCFMNFYSLYTFVHTHEAILEKSGRMNLFLLKTEIGMDVIHVFRDGLTLIWKGERYTGSNTVLIQNNFHVIPPQRL